MILKKTDVLSPCTLTATVALFAVLMSGCERQGGASLEEVYPMENNAYMHDPKFRAQLDGQVKERDGLRKQMLRAKAELDALVKERNGDYSAATNTARGAELAAIVQSSETLFYSNRMETSRILRERMLKAMEDSKRIQRGEAKAVAIPQPQNAAEAKAVAPKTANKISK